jgi:hypothetical protein
MLTREQLGKIAYDAAVAAAVRSLGETPKPEWENISPEWREVYARMAESVKAAVLAESRDETSADPRPIAG